MLYLEFYKFYYPLSLKRERGGVRVDFCDFQFPLILAFSQREKEYCRKCRTQVIL
jgi:hypothetical protein